MAIEFRLPEVGENIDQAKVIRLLVAVDETLQLNQVIMEIETDKASLEITSEVGGRITSLNVSEGGMVDVGAVVLTVEEDAEEKMDTDPADTSTGPALEIPDSTQTPQPVRSASVSPAPEKSLSPPIPVTNPAVTPPPASPSVRKLARELGVDISQVAGSNPGGRISDSDVKAHAKGLITSVHRPALTDQDSGIEMIPFTQIRSIIAEKMTRSWTSIPHVHQHDKADITQLDTIRHNYNQKLAEDSPRLTVTAVIIRILGMLLKKFPELNSQLDMENNQLLLKKQIHVGVAVDSGRGLLVPVIRDVGRKSILDIIRELDDIARRTRSGDIKSDELRGSTFTLSNLGGIGGVAFNPIINPPEVAILGVAKAERLPVYHTNGKIEIRLMLPLCLGYDHRIIDGAQGARFTHELAECMGNPLDLMFCM